MDKTPGKLRPVRHRAPIWSSPLELTRFRGQVTT